jgi:chemotaxis signal transduction protein
MKETLNPHEGLAEAEIKLLLHRAQQLSRTADLEEVTQSLSIGTARDKYLVVRLHDKWCGFPLTSVCEVLPVRVIEVIPGAPEHVTGLTRLRGRQLVLIDLRRFWSEDPTGHSDSNIAMVLESGDIEFGILCSEIDDLQDCPPEDIREAPTNLPVRLAACLGGFYRDKILMVSVEKLLAQPGFIVRQNLERG